MPSAIIKIDSAIRAVLNQCLLNIDQHRSLILHHCTLLLKPQQTGMLAWKIRWSLVTGKGKST